MKFMSTVYAGNVKVGEPNRVSTVEHTDEETVFPLRDKFKQANRTIDGAALKGRDPGGVEVE